MRLSLEFVSPPATCGYLPDRLWQFENALIETMTPAEYQRRMEQGWRRFGRVMFRPRCPDCNECRSLRVDVQRFRPNRSQMRNRRLNEGVVVPTIGEPQLSPEALDLYDRYHAHQSTAKGWQEHPFQDAGAYFDSFVDQPFPVEEWRYQMDGRLVGIGYVDRLPSAISAIYFFSDPQLRQRGLGTWNVLSIIERAAQLDVPFVYLGYHIDSFPSLTYKANFVPNQKQLPDGTWQSFRT
jgi:arginyl-tRNA--protein-N-Asp/Glu arginylyltransferase